MSYTNEDIRKAGELFFHLLNNRILPSGDILASQFFGVTLLTVTPGG